ncbi:MAG TPA: hypothetical protein PLN21_17215 [Gemmatales bacterium]|nr:hypothetical protein [Gemmatales bacterium]
MHAIAFGSRFYGKTDCVKGLFYVATKFGHIDYVPIIPNGTYCIWNCDGVRIETSIPFSGKSILKGFLRTWMSIIGVFMTLGCLMFREIPHMAWLLGTLAALCFLIVLITYLGQKPSLARALFLASCIGMSPERLAEHYLNDPQIIDLM